MQTMQLTEKVIQLKIFFSIKYHGLWCQMPFSNLKQSKPVSILFVKYKINVSVEWFLQNPDWCLYRILLSAKYSIV